jgi:hypothetical protein
LSYRYVLFIALFPCVDQRENVGVPTLPQARKYFCSKAEWDCVCPWSAHYFLPQAKKYFCSQEEWDASVCPWSTYFLCAPKHSKVSVLCWRWSNTMMFAGVQAYHLPITQGTAWCGVRVKSILTSTVENLRVASPIFIAIHLVNQWDAPWLGQKNFDILPKDQWVPMKQRPVPFCRQNV